MVIHQPSSHVFESFDKLMLMAGGQMVYFGERVGMVDYLANQGFKCHPNFNPADYICMYHSFIYCNIYTLFQILLNLKDFFY